MMRARTMTITALALLAITLAPHLAPAAPAAKAASIPMPVIRKLDNGLTVAVFQDPRLPIVQIQLLVPAGSAQEAPGESGVASLTAQMLSQGTASRTALQFATAVEALGGSVGGNAAREFTAVNGSFLSADFETGLELLADAVVHPIFDESQLALLKEQTGGTLVRARQNPPTVADELLWSAVFAGHPYGASPIGSLRTLPALGVTQVRSFHRDQYRPDHALLAIAGDVTPERAFQAAQEVLASWGGRTRVREMPPPAPGTGWRVQIVDAPGMTRAELRLGCVGPSRAAPDRLALEAAVEALNAGGDPARARVSAFKGSGLVSVAFTAPVDSAGAAVARVRAMLARWTAERPAEPVVAAVKRRLANSYTLGFDTRSVRIAQWMGAAFAGLPPDAVSEYPAHVSALGAADLHNAAAHWVTPDRMVLIAIGPAEVLKSQLASLGTVEVVPPEGAIESASRSPSTDTTPPTEAQLARGRELVAQMIAAHGGLEKLRGIKDSTLEGDVLMVAGGRQITGQMTQIRKDPNRFLFSTRLGVLKAVQVLDGERGWAQGGGDSRQIQDQDSLGVIGLKSGFRSDLHHLLLTAVEPGARVAGRGEERVDEREADVLEVIAADGDRRVLFLDPRSHQMMAMEQGEGGHSARRLYSDMREVNGILWPFHEERLLDGQPAMTVGVRKVTFNTGVRDETFRRPGGDSGTRRPRPR